MSPRIWIAAPFLTLVTWIVDLFTSRWEEPRSAPEDSWKDTVDEVILIGPATDDDDAGKNTTRDFVIVSPRTSYPILPVTFEEVISVGPGIWPESDTF
jgi:hypothetical protein